MITKFIQLRWLHAFNWRKLNSFPLQQCKPSDQGHHKKVWFTCGDSVAFAADKPSYMRPSVGSFSLKTLLQSTTKAQTPLVRFVVQQLEQQIHNKSTANSRLFNKFTTNPQHLDMSRCCGFDVDSTKNPQKIESMAFDLSKLSRKAVQQIHNFSTSRTTCFTTNPQQIHHKSSK
jgi:hypothetical protein